MTVCTASIFLWNYSQNTEPAFGTAIVAATDRMLTDLGLGIEYEGSRWKTLVLGTHHLVLVSGDTRFNSEALADLQADFLADGKKTTREISEELGLIVSRLRRKKLSKRYLAPLNLTEETFLSRQQELSGELVLDLASKFQNDIIEAEYLVIGADDLIMSMYRVDSFGDVSNHNDIGFLSIGIGGIHASAQFMLEPYNHTSTYYHALYSTFLAKKRAEVAPGVGSLTDMFLVTRFGAQKVPDATVGALQVAYRAQLRSDKRFRGRLEKRIMKEDAKIRKLAEIPLTNDPAPASDDTAPPAS